MTDEPPAPTPDIPAPPTGRHLSARDALICVGVCVLVLLAFEGRSLERSGDRMKPGWQRTLVLAVGRPAGAVSEASGLGKVKDRLLSWAHPDDGLHGPGGFNDTQVTAAGGGVPPVTPDAFDPRSLGADAKAPRPLRTVLVTGDSLSQPLDAKVARAFSKRGTGVKVVRDARLGTSISQSDILDWGRLSVSQVRKLHPEAVIMFMGANEGFPLRVGGQDVKCCAPAWAAAYASRARRMMSTYRQAGAARVYWLTLPTPRDADRQKISRAVNQAITVAAEPYRAQVRIVDMVRLFTPTGYRDAMDVGGRPTIVRESDGIHLNDAGTDAALTPVLAALHQDFGAPVP